MITLIIVAVVFSITLYIAHACYRLYKLNHQQTAKIASLQSQLAILSAGAVGTDERIIRFERALQQLKEQQHTLDLGINSQQGYDHAIRLARKGASISQLIDNCNLSDEEAHLISRLHNGDHQSSQAELH